jgi:hypothetical protein
MADYKLIAGSATRAGAAGIVYDTERKFLAAKRISDKV